MLLRECWSRRGSGSQLRKKLLVTMLVWDSSSFLFRGQAGSATVAAPLSQDLDGKCPGVVCGDMGPQKPEGGDSLNPFMRRGMGSCLVIFTDETNYGGIICIFYESRWLGGLGRVGGSKCSEDSWGPVFNPRVGGQSSKVFYLTFPITVLG